MNDRQAEILQSRGTVAASQAETGSADRAGPTRAVAAVVAPPRAAAQGWTTATPLPLARYEAPNIALNGKIYVFGGDSDAALNSTSQVHVYDPAADTWTYLTDIPTPAGVPSGLTHHGIVFIATSSSGSPVTFSRARALAPLWPMSGGTTSPPIPGPPAPTCPPPVAAASCGSAASSIYFGGLMADRNTDAGDHWILNLDQATSSWVSAAPLLTPRTHFSAVELNGKIYAVGGRQAQPRLKSIRRRHRRGL